MCRRLAIVLVFLLSRPLYAAPASPDIQVLALFANHAVLMVNGMRSTLRAGERGPDGIRLLSATSDQAVLEVHGRRLRVGLGTDVPAAGRENTDAPEVRIYRNVSGMFTTVGSINGLPVSFLVDTGATQVAMNAAEANHLGIDFRVVGTPVQVGTASGTARAYRVNLDTVRVGAIALHQVSAVVILGDDPPTALLGMSFLGRLNMRNQGQCLVLRKSY